LSTLPVIITPVAPSGEAAEQRAGIDRERLRAADSRDDARRRNRRR